MADGEWHPPHDLLIWMGEWQDLLQTLLERSDTANVTDAVIADALREALDGVPGPVGAVANDLMKRMDAGEDVPSDEAYEKILDAVTNGGTDR